MAKASTYKPNSEPQILRNLSNADMARIDKQKVMQMEGRDLSKMFRIVVGKTQYFFSDQDKYNNAVKKYRNG